MSEFTSILTHARRLQAAVKELSVAELELVAEKLQKVIEAKKEEEAEAQREIQKKEALRNSILKQMEEVGLDVDDLLGSGKAASDKPKVKRPIKYKMIDEEGQEVTWTGIGRTPKAFAKAMKEGKALEQFAI